MARAQAMLPDELEEITLGYMMIGESGFTIPWAMSANPEGKLYLDLGHTYDKNPGGPGKTTNMRVERTSEGFVVDLMLMDRMEYRWTKGHLQSNVTWAPVVKLIR